jgi:hypothetical protein
MMNGYAESTKTVFSDLPEVFAAGSIFAKVA